MSHCLTCTTYAGTHPQFRGAPGISGPKGAVGDKGSCGSPGLCGLQGEKGAQGPPTEVHVGAVYTRWGKTNCSSDKQTELVYSGIAGGSYFS